MKKVKVVFLFILIFSG
ncbi:TPA: colicin release lysis protein, partial [Klebsiella pneumoniae]|nr:colicin release lysis protein [Klebsiella pneumoniae]HBV8809435.1 colicin release lysis protein [Klebsiella pneumoniae]